MKINTLTLQALFSNPTLQALDAFASTQGVQLYLVGGSVRDLMLDRQTTDFDFALASDAIHFAKAFAAKIRATCIVLEENPSTARVIAKQCDPSPPSQLSMDFVQFRATSLADDLRLRDLTINAMAIAFENTDSATDQERNPNSPRVIDPCAGMKDLESGLLRFPSEHVVLADPVRLLRIYRFAAQLGFKIAESAIACVQKHRGVLPSVAAERCRAELMKILDVEKAHPHLRQMDAVGLLREVLPVVTRAHIPWQWLEKFEETPIPNPLHVYRDEINKYLQEELGDGVSRRSLIKLSLLLGDNFGSLGKGLRLSRKAMQFIKCVISTSKQLFEDPHQRLTRERIIGFLKTAASDWWGVLLYSTAAHPIDAVVINQITDTYYEHILPIRKQGRLITGTDLIQIFNLKEGKRIGELLKQVEKRQFAGEIRTREDALAAVEILIRESQ